MVATVEAIELPPSALDVETSALGSLSIYQVHCSSEKMNNVIPIVGSQLENFWQPYIYVRVSGLDILAMQGKILNDTRDTIMIIMRKWAEAHGLRVKQAMASLVGANRD